MTGLRYAKRPGQSRSILWKLHDDFQKPSSHLPFGGIQNMREPLATAKSSSCYHQQSQRGLCVQATSACLRSMRGDLALCDDNRHLPYPKPPSSWCLPITIACLAILTLHNEELMHNLTHSTHEN
eukprot:scaffold217368_cov16-Prasinocladus_malaysianus.AAC.1